MAPAKTLRTHYISFITAVAPDRLQMVKLCPEGIGEGGGYAVWIMFKNEYCFGEKDRETDSFFSLNKVGIYNPSR